MKKPIVLILLILMMFQSIAQKIKSYEYWVDDNLGLKVATSITPVSNLHLQQSFDMTQVSNGLHVLTIRFADTTDTWSTPVSQFFFRNPTAASSVRKIIGYEYWFDDNASSRPYHQVSPTSRLQLTESLNLNSLSTGLHVIYIRFRDDLGVWSTAICQFFINKPNPSFVNRQVVGYEYWFDENIAARTYQAVTPSTQFHLAESLNLGSLPHGLHVISFRFRDETGSWSTLLSQFIFNYGVPRIVPNKAVSCRFWFDDDLNTLEEFNLPQPAQYINWIDTVETPFLNIGNHTINYQFKDSNKVYSSIRTDTFSITSCLPHGGRAIAGPADVCYGHTGVVYSIREIKNATGYAWSVPTGATIVSGDNTHAITVDFSMSAVSGNVTLYASNPCGNGETITFPVTVHPAPVPVITGATTVCTGPPGSVYSTEAGNSNYLWTVSPGNTIIGGGGTDDATVTVSWNVTSAQWIRLDYTIVAGCSASVPTQLNVSVDLLPGPAGAITGPSNVGPNQTGVVYSVAPIADATGYAWTLPTGATIVEGDNTNTITVDFSLFSISGILSVKGTNLCGVGPMSPPFMIISLANILNINKQMVGAGQVMCFDAVQTIIVAGGLEGAFTVAPSGYVTMIAGQNIRFLPISTVYSGGYLHAYITTTGQFCTFSKNSLMETSVIPDGSDPPKVLVNLHSHILIFPNPSSAIITIMPKDSPIPLPAQVKIFSLTGLQVLQRELESVGKNVISMDGLAPGMYLVHIRSAGWLDVVKVVKE